MLVFGNMVLFIPCFYVTDKIQLWQNSKFYKTSYALDIASSVSSAAVTVTRDNVCWSLLLSASWSKHSKSEYMNLPTIHLGTNVPDT